MVDIKRYYCSHFCYTFPITSKHGRIYAGPNLLVELLYLCLYELDLSRLKLYTILSRPSIVARNSYFLQNSFYAKRLKVLYQKYMA